MVLCSSPLRRSAASARRRCGSASWPPRQALTWSSVCPSTGWGAAGGPATSEGHAALEGACRVRKNQMWRMDRWSAVAVVLGLFVMLGGCQWTRNDRTLALSEQSIAVLERDLASARQEQQRVREGWVLYTLGVV